MSSNSGLLVLPRPGREFDSNQSPVPGPTEKAFVETFGQILPAAQFLVTDTGKAAYYELPPVTDKSGTPDRVLFIHGVQTPALGMAPLAKALQEFFPHAHLLLVDLWGHGLSDTPIVPHESALFHQLLDSLLDHLKWPSAHLIGFSFGGALTAGYVASRPSRVDSFVLVAPAGLLSFSNFSAEEQALIQGDDEKAASEWIVSWLEGGELVIPEDWKDRVQKGQVVAEAVRDWQTRAHPGHNASVVAIFRDGGVMDKHAVFKDAVETGIPSLAVLGELDGVCNEDQLREVGFTDVTVVPQAGHGVVRENVPEVAALISKFWNKLG